MDKIREQLSKPLVAGALGFLVGLVFGLFVLGWWLTPVEWYNASPAELHPDFQALLLRTAIDSYSVNRDPIQAKQVWDNMGEAAPAILAVVKTQPGTLSTDAITAFEVAVTAGVVVPPGGVATSVPTEEPAGGGSSLLTLALVMCVVVLLLGWRWCCSSSCARAAFPVR
jgi:hypothetical protein